MNDQANPPTPDMSMGADPTTCPECGTALRRDVTQMPLWFGATLNLVSDIPVSLCDGCGFQHIAPDVDAAIGRVVQQGFPDHRQRDVVAVPVFSLDDFRDDGVATLTLPEGQVRA
ncbi:MAG: YgiT-type zinc finger protein [Pseudomonadota bacterium]|nr:YgiT-type zinc finger protein [Pseudomonadota bacterium]